jgi:hypothetical protein
MKFNSQDFIKYLYFDIKKKKLDQNEILNKEHNFFFNTEKDFDNIYNFYKRINKNIPVNNYWNIRQEVFKYYFDRNNLSLKIKNETNLESYNHSDINKNNFFVKYVYLFIKRKLLFILGIKDRKLNNQFKQYNLSQIYLNNHKKIIKIKKNTKIININKRFPERTYWLIKILEQLFSLKNKALSKTYAIDIGPGPSINAGYLAYKYRIKFLLVDLPIQTLVGLIVLNNFFPNLKVCQMDIKKIIKKYKSIKNAFKYYDIIYITPNDIELINERIFSIALNTHAFQEMSKKTINDYMFFLRKNSIKRNIFLNINREKKRLNLNYLYNFENIRYNKDDKVLYKKIISNIDNYGKLGGDNFIIKSVILKTI